MANTLFEFFVPGVDYCYIGSRAYMNCSLGTDYDVMFHHYDRDVVINKLGEMGIVYETNSVGAVKFRLDIFPTHRFFTTGLNYIDVNFCFVEDYDAWKKATETMLTLSDNQGTEFFIGMSKKGRVSLFNALVQQNGGSAINILHSSF
jgi:hypothetical protein